MKKMRIGVVFDEMMMLHREHSAEHPERPERIMAIYLNLVKKDLFSQLVRIGSDEAGDEDLLLAHKQAHVKHVQEDGQGLGRNKNLRTSQVDTYMNKYTDQAAAISAGSTVEAVAAVCSQMMVDNAFAIVRPPGHHAHSNQVAGFCFYNNVGVAARVAQKKYGAKKVCIFDWDVHVGDGTSQIFYDDPSVLYISIHRFDQGKFYPGQAGAHTKIGEGAGKGFNIHFPFNVAKNQKPIIGDKDYIYACEKVFFPLIREFQPDLMIISAGFDSAEGDPLGEIGVTPTGYAYMTWCLRNLCPKTAVILEGGYDLAALERSSESVVRTLLLNPKDTAGFDNLISELSGREGLTQQQLETESLLDVRESFKQTASSVAKAHKKYWPQLSHLICEKVRSRRGSGISSSQASNDSPCSSDIGQATGEVPHVGGKPRTQSFNAENAMQHALGAESNPQSRPRADSYVVNNPIPEEDKM